MYKKVRNKKKNMLRLKFILSLIIFNPIQFLKKLGRNKMDKICLYHDSEPWFIQFTRYLKHVTNRPGVAGADLQSTP